MKKSKNIGKIGDLNLKSIKKETVVVRKAPIGGFMTPEARVNRCINIRESRNTEKISVNKIHEDITKGAFRKKIEEKKFSSERRNLTPQEKFSRNSSKLEQLKSIVKHKPSSLIETKYTPQKTKKALDFNSSDFLKKFNCKELAKKRESIRENSKNRLKLGREKLSKKSKNGHYLKKKPTDISKLIFNFDNNTINLSNTTKFSKTMSSLKSQKKALTRLSSKNIHETNFNAKNFKAKIKNSGTPFYNPKTSYSRTIQTSTFSTAKKKAYVNSFQSSNTKMNPNSSSLSSNSYNKAKFNPSIYRKSEFHKGSSFVHQSRSGTSRGLTSRRTKNEGISNLTPINLDHRASLKPMGYIGAGKF